MTLRTLVSRSLAVLAFGVLTGVFACGSDPVGVETCRTIEQARCENAPSCGLSLEQPVHRGDSVEDDVRACIQFYEDACRHGLAAPTDPGALELQACVDAINTGDCNVVRAPETHPACAFLVPPAATSTADAAVAP